jgi:hypothetical protein
MLFPAINQLASQYGQVGLYIPQAGCPPLLDTSVRMYVNDAPTPVVPCKEINDAALRLIDKLGIQKVILSARWSLYSVGGGYLGNVRAELSDPMYMKVPETNAAIFSRGFLRTVTRLESRHHNIVLIGPVPESQWNVRLTLARSKNIGTEFDFEQPMKDYRARNSDVLTLFSSAARQGDLKIINPSDRLCDNRACKTHIGERPLYFDDNHLTIFGAEYLKPALEDIFR